jgi:hypothetical protein
MDNKPRFPATLSMQDLDPFQSDNFWIDSGPSRLSLNQTRQCICPVAAVDVIVSTGFDAVGHGSDQPADVDALLAADTGMGRPRTIMNPEPLKGELPEVRISGLYLDDASGRLLSVVAGARNSLCRTRVFSKHARR